MTSIVSRRKRLLAAGAAAVTAACGRETSGALRFSSRAAPARRPSRPLSARTSPGAPASTPRSNSVVAAATIIGERAARYGVLHSYDADSNWTFENFIGWVGGDP
ncbi:hypothetical protein ACWDWU_16170 [Streptomyces sp. NPDC003442]